MQEIVAYSDILIFLSGLIVGIAISFFFLKLYRKKNDEALKDNIESVQSQLKNIVQIATMEANNNNVPLLLGALKEVRESSNAEMGMHKSEIASYKESIDKRMDNMILELNRFNTLVHNETLRSTNQFTEFRQLLQTAALATESLTSITDNLNKTLSNNQARGQWAERIAEDILKSAGFVEGGNYTKQQIMSGDNKKPDYTFFMPDGKILNMDVKFPFANYQHYIESEGKDESYLKSFLSDVKKHINDINTRQYRNPAEGTLDCAIMFIPNESLYSFIIEEDYKNGSPLKTLADSYKIIICSPYTLIAVLSIIRQASTNLMISQKADLIIRAVTAFKKEWVMYSDEFSKFESAFNRVHENFGKLSLTRSKKLEKAVEKVEALDVTSQSLGESGDKAIKSLEEGKKDEE